MTDKDYLKLAVEEAKKSVNAGGFPAGAILVKNGEIEASTQSLGFIRHDPTSHAETQAVRNACEDLVTSDLRDSVLYASLQPCLMCFSAANWANVSKIVYGCKKTQEMIKNRYYEGSTDVDEVNKNNTHKIELEYIPDYEEEMLELITSWEKSIQEKFNLENK